MLEKIFNVSLVIAMFIALIIAGLYLDKDIYRTEYWIHRQTNIHSTQLYGPFINIDEAIVYFAPDPCFIKKVVRNRFTHRIYSITEYESCEIPPVNIWR